LCAIDSCEDYNNNIEGFDSEIACITDCRGVGMYYGEEGRCEWVNGNCSFYGGNGEEGYFCRVDYDDIPDLSELKGAFVKLIVQNRSNQKWFDRMIKAIQQADVADLKIIEDLTLDAPEIKEDVKMEDTMSILETYVMDLEESVDKKNVVNILKSLYVESLNL
jgi:hypothetical protein